MGADLYWKITPPLMPDEDLNGINHNTWIQLSEALNIEEKEDCTGVELKLEDLPILYREFVDADMENNEYYKEGLSELIRAIKENKSITLVVRS
jgi:hypothetical protein